MDPISRLQAAWRLVDDRTGISEMLGPILRHPVPPDARWAYVFGSATLTAFLVQVATGIALATAYIPSTAEAYDSLRFITHDSFSGYLLRGMHFYGASAMVVLVGLHAAQTFLHAAYKFPREANWISGVFLLLVTLAMGFTGQLLRWDQNAVWSVVVGAEQAGRTPLIGDMLARFIIGGETLGGQTLSRFFSFHVFFIPAAIFALLGLHISLVLRHGISEMPRPGRLVDPKTYRAWYHTMLAEKGVPFWPDAAWRDVVTGAAVVAIIFLLALIFGPPVLGKPPDPSVVQAYPRPDWYLLWYFAALALIPPQIESGFILLFPLAGILLLLAMPFLSNRGERSPGRRPWALGLLGAVVVMVGVLWVAGERAAWSPAFDAPPLPPAVVRAQSEQEARGALLYHERGCQNCHAIAGYGGRRGPDLTYVGQRLTQEQMTIRILNGGRNMPPFAHVLQPEELDALVVFLQSRR